MCGVCVKFVMLSFFFLITLFYAYPFCRMSFTFLFFFILFVCLCVSFSILGVGHVCNHLSRNYVKAYKRNICWRIEFYVFLPIFPEVLKNIVASAAGFF